MKSVDAESFCCEQQMQRARLRDALAQIDPKTMIQFGPRSIRVAFDPLKNIYNGRLLYYQLEWTSIIRWCTRLFKYMQREFIRISKFCETEIVDRSEGEVYFDIDCHLLIQIDCSPIRCTEKSAL